MAGHRQAKATIWIFADPIPWRYMAPLALNESVQSKRRAIACVIDDNDHWYLSDLPTKHTIHEIDKRPAISYWAVHNLLHYLIESLQTQNLDIIGKEGEVSKSELTDINHTYHCAKRRC